MNFILAFLLLATLSMVNAVPHQLHKRDPTQFVACSPIPPSTTPPPLLAVAISPDPVVPGKAATFTISGDLNGPIIANPNSNFTRIVFIDPKTRKTVEDPFFVFATPLPQTMKYPAVPALPKPYVISVAIVDTIDKTVLGC